MRLHVFTLAALLAAGCTAQDDAGTFNPNADAADPAPAPAPEPAPTGPSPEAPAATVPQQFRGDYAADTAACTAAGHVTHLGIDASRIAFHESSGEITAVEHRGNDIDITANLTGEGETREATYHFRLSDDGRTLTDTDHGMARQRCD
jgi:hypothetical protein